MVNNSYTSRSDTDFRKSAAKLLHHTAKTCQCEEKNALFLKKMHFFQQQSCSVEDAAL